MIIHIIRTPKLPFAESNASRALYFSTAAVIAVAAVIAFSTLAVGLDMLPLPISYLPWLAALLVGYALASQLFKFAYLRRYGQWL